MADGQGASMQRTLGTATPLGGIGWEDTWQQQQLWDGKEGSHMADGHSPMGEGGAINTTMQQ